MAWKDEGSRIVQGKKYTVASETLTTYEGRAVWSSVVDFVPPGTDFVVIANEAATNLSVSTHLELFYSNTKTAAVAARYRIDETPFIPVTGELDASRKRHLRDVSAKGQYANYWFKIPSGGGSVKLTMHVGASA